VEVSFNLLFTRASNDCVNETTLQSSEFDTNGEWKFGILLHFK